LLKIFYTKNMFNLFSFKINSVVNTNKIITILITVYILDINDLGCNIC